MSTLSSRPVAAPSAPTSQELMKAAAPSMNILKWLSRMMVYPDQGQHTVLAVHQMIKDALACMGLLDYAVVAIPSPSAHELHYDVAVKAIVGPYVVFKVSFVVRP